ncbi:MAG TPA: superoxide dismutase [Tissierellia bacterium]|nr:superoxide dismutase [Tissierellia bacterium]
MKILEAKNYNFSNVKYFSPLQLSEHYLLYTRYINSLNEVNGDLKENEIYNNCNSNYSDIRSAQKAKTFCFDAVKLHELYFENLTGNNTKIHGPIEEIIEDNFSSYDSFRDKFKCIGMSMRGWVLLCYDRYNNEFYIYGQDSHDNGVMLYAEPLIVMDVYEHAYMIDFGTNRSIYIDAFFQNLDFNVVNQRIRKI